MKGNNQNNYDRRPKRRKDKLNPYTIYSVGVNTDEPHYYVSFVDVNSNKVIVEISKEVFDAFDKFELDDLSHFNEVTNHYDGSDSLEEELLKRSIEEGIDIAEVVIDKLLTEKLNIAISLLTETQRRRIYYYYFEGFTYEEIARKEQRDYKTIVESINGSKEKIKKILNDPHIFAF